jgi:hypothetical protein
VGLAADVAGIMRGALLCQTTDVGTSTNAICNIHGRCIYEWGGVGRERSQHRGACAA